MDQKQVEAIEAALLAAREAAGGGELVVVETDIPGAEVLAFRIPRPEEWKRYRAETDRMQEPVLRVTGNNNLVHACCVYPEAALFKRIVDAHPGIVETCLDPLLEHAGAARAKKVRKL